MISNNSTITQIFEEGKKLEKIYGKENVYDFSLGSPRILVPSEELNLKENLNMSEDTREIISKSINKKNGTNFNKENIIITAGATSGLNTIFKNILNPNDEVIVFAPYYIEYNNSIKSYNGKIVAISPNTKNFLPNIEEFKQKITPNTKAVLINTPNNPTGIVYSKETIKNISKILEEKQEEYKHEIFIISDEPYRELAYDGVEVPYITKYYKNTFIVYSYSKIILLPNVRIGYIVVPNEMQNSNNFQTSLTQENIVNLTPSLKRIITRCTNEKIDLTIYNQNRQLLYDSFIKYGFECTKPQGAFYIFLKSPIENDKEFCKKAKEFNLLFVPGSSFACPGHVRIAYCVSTEIIKNSLPAFEKLAHIYFK